MDEPLEALADLLRRRNEIDARIGGLLGRPMTAGHAGEHIAARIFDIQLEASAVAPAIDGRFRGGLLAGRSVNIKWYLKREALLDMSASDHLDYYLVLSGPPNSLGSSRNALRPWVITNVYLFDAQALHEDLTGRGLKVGTASSVRGTAWAAAEVFPREDPRLPLTPQQKYALQLFAPTGT